MPHFPTFLPYQGVFVPTMEELNFALVLLRLAMTARINALPEPRREPPAHWLRTMQDGALRTRDYNEWMYNIGLEGSLPLTMRSWK